jgi:hypothetical protein
VALATLGFVLIAALAGGAFWVRQHNVALGPDNCPSTGPHAVHVILVDQSDPISGQQAQRIRQWYQLLKANAVAGTRFDIYTFEGDTENALQPVLSICAPDQPEHADPLIQNPQKLRKRYEEKFAAVLDRTVEGLLQATTRPNSPIIESLRAAAQTSFGLHGDGRIPFRVTLISDLVQHSTVASHFRSEANFEQLSHGSSWARLRPELRGADVDILYILRANALRGAVPIQNRGHQDFWARLIAASGGRVTEFTPF